MQVPESPRSVPGLPTGSASRRLRETSSAQAGIDMMTAGAQPADEDRRRRLGSGGTWARGRVALGWMAGCSAFQPTYRGRLRARLPYRGAVRP
ncbi:hypothetical protein GCM10027570_27860 [Streptomonospora sediminis]